MLAMHSQLLAAGTRNPLVCIPRTALSINAGVPAEGHLFRIRTCTKAPHIQVFFLESECSAALDSGAGTVPRLGEGG